MSTVFNIAFIMMRQMNISHKEEQLMSLKELFYQLYLHTRDECAHCFPPFNCCEKRYCDMATKHAKDIYNLDITNLKVREDIPYLDSKRGCLIEPHLRPICTLHTCEISRYGCKRNDPEWTQRYYELRGMILKEWNLNLEDHIQWLYDEKEIGDINELQFEIARMLHNVPAAYIEQSGLRYTWMSERFMIVMLIGKDGSIKMTMMKREGK
jgi:hypothetical protein